MRGKFWEGNFGREISRGEFREGNFGENFQREITEGREGEERRGERGIPGEVSRFVPHNVAEAVRGEGPHAQVRVGHHRVVRPDKGIHARHALRR